ncbi:MAG: flagellar basal body-associated FliL family protein [Sulfuritalea sp.]|nr:flagellar basal body-associated FliL family protein [Sulfuritalea sp.]
MAEAKKTEAPAAEEAPKKKSKLLLIILIAALVLMFGGGGLAFFLMKKGQAEAEAEEGGEPPAKAARAKKAKDAGPPVFAKLDPFVVKLQQGGPQEAYVQAVPELRLLEAPTAEQIKSYMPEIRHRVLLILAGKSAAELSTPQGMQTLANQIRETINATLTGAPLDVAAAAQDQAAPDAPVQAVFFSSLIVQ